MTRTHKDFIINARTMYMKHMYDNIILSILYVHINHMRLLFI